MATQIFILVSEGVAGSTLMSAIDLFTTCNRIAQQINNNKEELFDVKLCAHQSQIEMNNGQRIQCSTLLHELSHKPILLIPAPLIATAMELDEYLSRNVPLLKWLGSQGKSSPMIATHCSGVALLAEAGLLEGKKVTTAWFLARELKKRYPGSNFQSSALLQKSSTLITGGATSAINDVVLAMVERFAGAHYSRLLAKYMLLDNQRSNQAPYAILSDISTEDDVILRATKWLRQNLAIDFCVDDIATEVGVSARTLIRRVRNGINESPQSLTQKLRIEKSKVLLETTGLPLIEIVARVGYSDESAFRRIFSRLVGQSPIEYRRRFKSEQ